MILRQGIRPHHHYHHTEMMQDPEKAVNNDKKSNRNVVEDQNIHHRQNHLLQNHLLQSHLRPLQSHPPRVVKGLLEKEVGEVTEITMRVMKVQGQVVAVTLAHLLGVINPQKSNEKGTLISPYVLKRKVRIRWTICRN